MNVPQFGHAIVLAIVEAMIGVLTDAVIVLLAIKSRAVNDRCVTNCLMASTFLFSSAGETVVEAIVHVIGAIDPADFKRSEPENMLVFLAFECTQAAPQSSRLNDAAFQNI